MYLFFQLTLWLFSATTQGRAFHLFITTRRRPQLTLTLLYKLCIAYMYLCMKHAWHLRNVRPGLGENPGVLFAGFLRETAISQSRRWPLCRRISQAFPTQFRMQILLELKKALEKPRTSLKNNKILVFFFSPKFLQKKWVIEVAFYSSFGLIDMSVRTGGDTQWPTFMLHRYQFWNRVPKPEQ